MILIQAKGQNPQILKEKLKIKSNMEVQRVISWFDKDSEAFVGEFTIDEFIDLDTLTKIFQLLPDDPLMYMVYDITPEIARTLNTFIPFNFDFEKFIFQLDCFQANS